MFRLIFLFIALAPTAAFAQLPPACNGTSSAIICEQACISCNFDGYTGSSQGYPSGPATDFCGTVENAQWIGFIAGAIQATFTVYPADCTDGNGVQIALYDDCTQPPLACNKGQDGGGNLPVSITTPLTPGRNYFLLIDGYAGDQCDFSVDVSPKEAVYEPPLGTVQQDIQGKIEGCPGAVFSYAVAPVFGAGAYVWDGPPGTLVNGDSVPVAVPAAAGGNVVQVTLGSQSGSLCVQAANSCSINPPCSGSIFINILDDTHRPVLATDTVVGIGCTDGTARLRVEVLPPANYVYQWVADSTGNLLSGANSPTARANQTGMYAFTATNTVTGCSGSASVRVGEPEYPSEVGLDLRHVTCFGNQDGILNIGTVSGGAQPYVYALNGGVFQVPTEFRHLPPGSHLLTVQASDGCEKDTVFTMLEPDDLVLTLPPDITVHLGEALGLWRDDALSDPARRKQTLVTAPLLPELLCDTCMYRPLSSFRYEVTVLDSNGCRASDERTVTVDRSRRVYFPNVFAPESPDDNAVFRINCGPDVVRVRSFRVFSRWGRAIVEQNDLAPSDPSLGWDGRINGEKAPPAVFVYVAEIEFVDGATEVFRGDVTVVR
ncbi:MAG: hypothetical protein ABMA02_14925 [Saprospiraceae bacterium]